MRSVLILVCLALAGCGDRSSVIWKDGEVDVAVSIYNAKPADAAARLRGIADGIDVARPAVEGGAK